MSTITIPVNLTTKDGTKRTLSLTRLNDGDIESIDEWLRSQYIQSARSSLSPDASDAERRETLSIAMDNAASLSMITPQGAKMIATVSGMARILWQATRLHHPELEYEELRSWFFDADNVEEVNMYMRRQTREASHGQHGQGGSKKGSPSHDKRSGRGSSRRSGGRRRKFES